MLVVLLVLGLSRSAASSAQPVQHNYFNFASSRPLIVPPGDVCLTWSSVPNAYKPGMDLSNQKFGISVMDLFEQELWADTIDRRLLRLTVHRDEHVIVRVTELATNAYKEVAIFGRAESLPRMSSWTDSLNFSLMHGHFLHASALLDGAGRTDLIEKLAAEYDFFFGPGYAEGTMFNTYFDDTKKEFVQMPYVSRHGALLQALRRGLKQTKFKGVLEIHATVRADNSLDDVVTVPSIDAVLVKNALQLLEIDRHGVDNAKLVLIVKSGWPHWRLLNKRAVTNPESPNFERPTPTGAVHR